MAGVQGSSLWRLLSWPIAARPRNDICIRNRLQPFGPGLSGATGQPELCEHSGHQSREVSNTGFRYFGIFHGSYGSVLRRPFQDHGTWRTRALLAAVSPVHDGGRWTRPFLGTVI